MPWDGKLGRAGRGARSALARGASAPGALGGVEGVVALEEVGELGDCEVELCVDTAVDGEALLEQVVAADGGAFDGESHAGGDVRGAVAAGSESAIAAM